MTVKHKKTVLTLANGAEVSVYYDAQTHLPRIHAYKNALSSANALSLQGCVTEETNQNLSPQQKILLKWHFRLGHLGFATVQWLGRNGMLGPFGEKMGAARLLAPKCAACQFGKQGRTPIPTHHSDKDPVGSLTKNKLEPGQLIFADQYESREMGRAFTTKGLASSHKFGGGNTVC
jgi:GAG-pre-integrase domain